jgi:hypothetical protein
MNCPKGQVVATGRLTGCNKGLALWAAMKNSPVTVTHLPVVRCKLCQRTVAYRPGQASAVLTEHYRRVHPEALVPGTR